MSTWEKNVVHRRTEEERLLQTGIYHRFCHYLFTELQLNLSPGLLPAKVLLVRVVMHQGAAVLHAAAEHEPTAAPFLKRDTVKTSI